MSGTAPARRSGWDPAVGTRWVRRVTWAVAGVALILFFACYGTTYVPAGMDTVPTMRPGSLCFVDKRRGAIRVGCHVFVDVPGGGTVLSQVTAIDGDRVTVHHPNPASRLPDSRAFGALPRAAVRSTVLVVFAPDGAGDGR